MKTFWIIFRKFGRFFGLEHRIGGGKARNTRIEFEKKETQKYNKERHALACRFEFLQNRIILSMYVSKNCI